MDYETDLILVFTSIIWEALPFIVLGVVIAGLLEEFVPQQAIARIIPRNRLLAICLGGLLGAVFPMCECGIIVVMRRLLRKGLPLSVCAAYMLAGPIINVVVLTSTFVAFNYPQKDLWILGGPWLIVALRAGLAFVIAVATAWLVEIQWRRYGTELLHPTVTRGLLANYEEDETAVPRSWKQRLSNITDTALHDFVDIMAFLVLGASVAAVGRLVLRESSATVQPPSQPTTAAATSHDAKSSSDGTATGQGQAAPPRENRFVATIKAQPWLAILIMMTAAVLFCLCSEADAFVAANFQTFWPPAAKMAFLVLGPMLDVKLYIMYTRVYRPRLIFTIIVAVVAQSFVYAMALHYLAPNHGHPPGLAR